MGDLSPNFSRNEWVCKCGCGFDTVDAELINTILQPAREELGRKITVTRNGGCRCKSWNKLRRGADNSQHTKGKAADIKVEGMTPEEVYKYFTEKFPDQYGFGLYPTFVHVDSRSGKARWKGKS